MLRSLFIASIIFTLTVGPASAVETIPGVGPLGPIKKVYGDFQFTEGPTIDRQGNLFFTDINANRIYKINSLGELSVFREPSNNADGLMFNAAGELVACEMQGQVAAYSADGKQRRVIAAGYNGVRFNAPNDLVIDRSGGIYFTDPHFNAPAPLPQGVEAVYYIDNKGKVARIIDDLKAPNGVILSPDEKTLYVIPSLQTEMMAYPVKSPGKLGQGYVFGALKKPDGAGPAGDGRAVDEKGNVYIASKLGVQIFSPAGKPLGIITFPEQPANIAFGGTDYKTLFVAARTSIYAVPMNVSGHIFGR